MKKSPIRFLWFLVGLICMLLGTVGIFVPVLPTVPFYLATVFCFTKSSNRLKEWFTQTELYKKHMESYFKNRGMSMQSKLRIIALSSLMIGITFFKIEGFPIVRLMVVLVWLTHVYVFFFKIKTL